MRLCGSWFGILLTSAVFGGTVSAVAQEGLTRPDPASHPLELGVLFQGGKGVTEMRGGFKFAMAGVHASKTLTPEFGRGPLRGSFAYGAELFPFWQSYTPKFQKISCIPSGTGASEQCSAPYTVGGTFSGISLTPIILRWDFHGVRRLAPWAQAAGGLLWTNHKYPAFGSTSDLLQNSGPSADASVWNFTPQGGVGVHYFLSPRHSIDLGANAVHISSASLGDRNPGVNASVQFNLGFSWWR